MKKSKMRVNDKFNNWNEKWEIGAKLKKKGKIWYEMIYDNKIEVRNKWKKIVSNEKWIQKN